MYVDIIYLLENTNKNKKNTNKHKTISRERMDECMEGRKEGRRAKEGKTDHTKKRINKYSK